MGPRLHAHPEAAHALLEHTLSAQGSRVPCSKDPSLLARAWWASSHVHSPEGSPHHSLIIPRPEGSQVAAACRGAEVKPGCPYVRHMRPLVIQDGARSGKRRNEAPRKELQGTGTSSLPVITFQHRTFKNARIQNLNLVFQVIVKVHLAR